jgi:hypothetical protein
MAKSDPPEFPLDPNNRSDAPREFIMEDDGGDELEAAAAQRRADAFDAVYEWHGKELYPWTIGREQQYFKLRAADTAVPLHVALRHPETFLGDAIKVLYLMHHLPEEWRALRMDIAAFVEAIDAWSEENIPRHEQSEAIDLALRVVNESASTQAIPRPTDKKSSDEGN